MSLRVGAFSVGFVVGSFAPAVASIIARLAQNEGLDDVSCTVRSSWTIRAIVIAWGWPVAAGLAVYGLTWISGAPRFRLNAAWPPYLLSLALTTLVVLFVPFVNLRKSQSLRSIYDSHRS
jgi:hypothetical protein